MNSTLIGHLTSLHLRLFKLDADAEHCGPTRARMHEHAALHFVIAHFAEDHFADVEAAQQNAKRLWSRVPGKR